MIKDLKSFVNYLNEQELTANQYVLMQMLLTDSFNELLGFSKLLSRQFLKSWRAEVDDLIKREFIEVSNPNEPYASTSFRVTEKLSGFNRCGYEQAHEFWEAYPTFCYTDSGKQLFLKNVSQSEFFNQYLSEVGHDMNAHQRMMQALEHARNFGYLNMKITTWLSARVYLDMQKEMTP